MLGFLLLSCSSFERSPESGYAKASTHSTQSGWKKKSSENSILKDDAVITDQKLRLKQLENSLSGKRELEQYSKSLPWFNNTQEKIEFLEIGNYEKRQEWLKDQDFPSRAKRIAMQMQEVVDAQDIVVGMPEALVKKSWGEPVDVEVSGSPLFHNQKWRYQKFVSSPDGYKSERKSVYFEGGKVVGWEVE